MGLHREAEAKSFTSLQTVVSFSFILKAMGLMQESDMIRLHFQKITQTIGREGMDQNQARTEAEKTFIKLLEK